MLYLCYELYDVRMNNVYAMYLVETDDTLVSADDPDIVSITPLNDRSSDTQMPDNEKGTVWELFV